MGGPGPEPVAAFESAAGPRHEDRFPAFLMLWMSQTLSLFGTMVTQFAVNVWLARDLYPLASQKPQLALALTATGFAATAPLIFGMPLAGAYADRHDRKRILVVANTVSALLSVGFVALSMSGRLSLPVAAAMLALYSLTSSFHSAAFDSTYGRFVSERDLPRASGMMMTSYGLSQLLAPPLAATLVALPALLGGPGALPAWLANGVPFAFAADGLTFVVAAIVAASLRFPPMPIAPHAVRGSLVQDVRAGFRWIFTRRPFLTLLGMGALANFTFAPLMVLLPLLARDRVLADAAARGMPFEAVLALANTAGGLGGVLGGVLVSVFGLRHWPRTQVMLWSLVVLGVGEVVTGLSTLVWGLALGMFVGELLVAPLNTASFTMWQDLTPPHMLARAGHAAVHRAERVPARHDRGGLGRGDRRALGGGDGGRRAPGGRHDRAVVLARFRHPRDEDARGGGAVGLRRAAVAWERSRYLPLFTSNTCRHHTATRCVPSSAGW